MPDSVGQQQLSAYWGRESLFCTCSLDSNCQLIEFSASHGAKEWGNLCMKEWSLGSIICLYLQKKITFKGSDPSGSLGAGRIWMEGIGMKVRLILSISSDSLDFQNKYFTCSEIKCN